MSNPEYDAAEPALEGQNKPVVHDDAHEDARRRERMQALEDEAIESEHIDNFLAGGADELL
ncbi:hypothetical protein [Mycetocola zhadangensis]|uniref:Uncharacterized protein n=1 Tax=Mycetocola zhadangensis TaxID=1164595 RepID=A0A3L7J0Z9_9MICO|nr:hypothetical protein [Mycetocola zhadangensis]RLQ84137.1 hypothetical protein D9V28_07860 [Mycetocola zhadangensis]GGE95861.1 hypothetical protein GCM10011313_18480 [Mycetocola zhadangensis]